MSILRGHLPIVTHDFISDFISRTVWNSRGTAAPTVHTWVLSAPCGGQGTGCREVLGHEHVGQKDMEAQGASWRDRWLLAQQGRADTRWMALGRPQEGRDVVPLML